MQVLSEEDKGRLFDELDGDYEITFGLIERIEQAVLGKFIEKALLGDMDVLKAFHGAAFCMKCGTLFDKGNVLEMIEVMQLHSLGCTETGIATDDGSL